MSISNLVNVRGNQIATQKITYYLFADRILSEEEKDYIETLTQSEFEEFCKSKGWHAGKVEK